MSSKYQTLKLSEILKRPTGSPKYVLPNFQRDFVWDTDGQQALLASFIAGLPIGSILLLEGDDKMFSARTFGFIDTAKPLAQCQYVLDGQQRLSTLRVALSDPFWHQHKWEDIWDRLYSKLRVRWYVDLKAVISSDGSKVEDILGIRNLKFDLHRLEKIEQEEVKEFLGFYKIYIKDKKKYFHPGFESELIENQKFLARNDKIGKELSSVFRIPLWELDQGSDGLHRLVLDNISMAQSDLKFAEEVDERLREQNKTRLTKEDRQEIRNSWIKQAMKWSVDVGNWLDQLFSLSEVPSILLGETDLPRAVGIFEAINRGGTPLSVFDLVVARSANEIGEKSLTHVILEKLATRISVTGLQSIDQFVQEMKKKSGDTTWGWAADEMFLAVKDGTLTTRTQNQFLNVLSLLKKSNRIAKGKCNLEELDVEVIKKGAILSLTAAEISNGTDKTVTAMNRAMAFLQIRCGVRSFEDLPYQLMILPIAFVLSEDKLWKNKSSIDKLEYWFWVSLFAGRYREKQNENCVTDVRILWLWCNKKGWQGNPFETSAKERLFNAQDYCDEKSLIPDKGEKLESRSPVRFAILSFILSRQPFDFLNKSERLSAWKWAAEIYVDVKCEVHHILPLKNASNLTDSSKKIRKDTGDIHNSPLNLTLISDTANRGISALPPAVYMKQIGEGQQASHFVPTSFAPQKGEDDDSYVRRMLKERFNVLKAGVWTQLNSLVT